MNHVFSLFIFLLLGWVLFAPLLSYGLFVYETSRSGPPASGRVCEFGLARCALLGIFSSLCCQLFMGLSYPLGLVLGAKRQTDEQDRATAPVVLVHGLYHNASAWILAHRLMQHSGFGSVYTPSFNTFRDTFDEMAAKLADLVFEVSTRHADAPVALMGHSLGGLLIKAIADDPRLVGRIGSIVTLGTPWQGSKLAVLAVGDVGRKLGQDGSIVTKAASHTVEAHVPRLCLYSPIDNMVMPNSSLIPSESGWQVEETALLPHSAMLYHRPTLNRAIAFLEHASSANTGRAAHA